MKILSFVINMFKLYDGHIVRSSAVVQSTEGVVSYLLHFSFRQYVQHNFSAKAEGVDECLYIGQDIELALGVQKILKELLSSRKPLI